MRERGLDVTKPILAFLDGAKALTAAVMEVFDHLHLPTLRAALERHVGAETVGANCNTQDVSAA